MQRTLSTVFSALRLETAFLAVCLGALLFSSILIPSLGGSLYASPDETAVALATEKMLFTGTPVIPEPLVSRYPWLHPRSWVSQGEAIVPVGFLGWPAFLIPGRLLLGSSWFVWAGWLLLISSFYPFFRLLRRAFSARAAWVGVVVMAASPAFILYANRSLFPNVGILAVALWSLWFLHASQDRPRWLWLAGGAAGLALAIRPIEALWLVPWWVALFSSMPIRKTLKELAPFLLSFLIVMGLFLALNTFTYGSPWKIGYWLKDIPVQMVRDASVSERQTVFTLSSFFPFGIHPRSILWNLKAFGTAFLWPTVLVLLASGFVYGSSKKWMLKEARSWVRDPGVLGAWTVCILVLVYGSGLYRDHVQLGAVTVGNSFLRYLLPMAPLSGMGAAYLYQKYSPKRWLMGVILFAYVVFGLHAVLYKDDESVLMTRRELRRYAQVLEAAKAFFPPGSVIVSERSDKIFASYARAVSPLPSLHALAALVRDKEANVQVGLYARPLSQAERDAWRREGIELIDKGVFAREHLYHLIPR